MTTPSEARLQYIKAYDRNRLRLEKKKDRSVRVRRQSETKKATRGLEEMCAAKSGYELIDMEDGTKSCRKKCRDPKPVRSKSKSRKCIAGTKGLEPRISPSHHSAKKGQKTPEEMCASKKGDYELIDMDDGTKSCRKRCRDPKPVRSKSKSRKCIKGEDRPQGKTRTKKANKDSDEAEYDEDDENNLDDDDDEEDEDSGSDDEYYEADFVDNDDDMDERAEQELNNILQNKFKKTKITSGADCLQAVSVKQMKDEITKRETDDFEKGYEAIEGKEKAKKSNKSQKSPSQRKSQKSPSQRKASPPQQLAPEQLAPEQLALMLAERKRLRDEKYKNKKVVPYVLDPDDVRRSINI